ncbi:MAG: hypothetical protein MJ077_08065 [Oscillospiraceae bacterium]|nr:hypothetical protein [Oscillospiraceae bacterium]
MKKNGKYQYTIQFSASAPENQRVGEFLERMGNKKSRVIIAALLEFLNAHPEIIPADSSTIEIRVDAPVSDNDLESMVRRIVGEQLASSPAPNEQAGTASPPDEVSTEALNTLLDNLELFHFPT